MASTSPPTPTRCPGCGPERVDAPSPRRPPGRRARPADPLGARAARTRRPRRDAEPPPVGPAPVGARARRSPPPGAAHRHRGRWAGVARLAGHASIATSARCRSGTADVARRHHRHGRRSASVIGLVVGLVAMVRGGASAGSASRVAAPPPRPLAGLTLAQSHLPGSATGGRVERGQHVGRRRSRPRRRPGSRAGRTARGRGARTARAAAARSPSTSTSTIGLSWKPSRRPVSCSSSSSRVPKPPGSATNASARRASSRLAGEHVGGDDELVGGVVGDLDGPQRLGDDADRAAAARPERPGPPPPSGRRWRRPTRARRPAPASAAPSSRATVHVGAVDRRRRRAVHAHVTRPAGHRREPTPAARRR